MKKVYIMLMSVMITGAAAAQQEHPINAIGNNSTAVGVTLSNFDANRQSNAVQLNWTAVGESNMLSHQVERSANGSNFTSIGTLTAQNNGTPYRYTFSDPTPVEGNNYYRLRSTDKTGKVALSSILRVDNGLRKQELRIISNPVRNGVLNMQMNNFKSGRYNIAMYSNAGQTVFTRSFDYSAGSATETINLPRQLARGTYFLHVTDGESRINKQVLLQ
jgi:hypothetical protein